MQKNTAQRESIAAAEPVDDDQRGDAQCAAWRQRSRRAERPPRRRFRIYLLAAGGPHALTGNLPVAAA